MKSHVRYSEEELTWLKANYGILGSKACAFHLHRSVNSVRQTANSLGCHVPLSLQRKLHSETLTQSFIPTILPETFQNVKIKEVAYVLGLLWAEGWVQNKSDYSINIKMIEEDFREILPVFYTIGEWKQYHYFPQNRKPTIQLRVSGKSLVDFFLSVDYHVKSSSPATKVLSLVPNTFKKYWWRGYFDGDGHIRSSHPYRIEFASSWNQDWSFLPSEFPFKISVITGTHSYSKARIWKKEDIIRFGSWIWENWDGIGLTRKYNEFSKLL